MKGSILEGYHYFEISPKERVGAFSMSLMVAGRGVVAGKNNTKGNNIKGLSDGKHDFNPHTGLRLDSTHHMYYELHQRTAEECGGLESSHSPMSSPSRPCGSGVTALRCRPYSKTCIMSINFSFITSAFHGRFHLSFHVLPVLFPRWYDAVQSSSKSCASHRI